jgi:hypothetical protein
MRVYIDLNSRAFVVSPVLTQRVTELLFTRRDNVPVEVQFVRNGVVVELGGGAAGKMGIKVAYDGDFLAYDSAWTKIGTGADTIYQFGLNLNTTELDAEFETDEEDSISAKVEIEWADSGLVSSTLPCAATIYNDVIRGDEAAPDTATALSDIDFSDGSGGTWRLSVDATGTLTTTKVA